MTLLVPLYRRVVLMVVAALVALALVAAPASAVIIIIPPSKEACKATKGEPFFRNQGQCIKATKDGNSTPT